jgi:sugar phosphate isomerase/epimerase
MGQLIDPVAQLKKWVGRVGHVHGKDAMSTGTPCVKAGFPAAAAGRFQNAGFWRYRLAAGLYHFAKAGYTGCVSIEGYQTADAKQWEYTGQKHALHYLKWARVGDLRPIRGHKPRAVCRVRFQIGFARARLCQRQ